MKTLRNPWTVLLLVMGALLSPHSASALDPGDIREFNDVFAVSASAADRESIEVRWRIEDGYYLYNNQFLRFGTETDGVVLGEPNLPAGKTGFDELLGQEVEKYYGELIVTVPIESVAPDVSAVRLKLRSQGCLEDELCYPPTNQTVDVALPPAPAGDALFSSYAPPLLSPEEAFVYESIGFDERTALVRFTIEPGHYLYRDKMAFSVASGEGFSVAEVQLPEGVIKDDPEFGPVPVYYDQVEVPVLLDRPAGDEAEVALEASFQGCRDGDVCYPPMTRVVTFAMPAAEKAYATKTDSGPQAAAAPVGEQDRLAAC